MYNYYSYQQQITTVNGEAGAQAYQMGANSSALLLDENKPLLYLARTDGAGYKTISTYTITEYKPEDPLAKIEERLTRLEAIISESNSAKLKPEHNEAESS